MTQTTCSACVKMGCGWFFGYCGQLFIGYDGPIAASQCSAAAQSDDREQLSFQSASSFQIPVAPRLNLDSQHVREQSSLVAHLFLMPQNPLSINVDFELCVSCPRCGYFRHGMVTFHRTLKLMSWSLSHALLQYHLCVVHSCILADSIKYRFSQGPVGCMQCRPSACRQRSRLHLPQ